MRFPSTLSYCLVFREAGLSASDFYGTVNRKWRRLRILNSKKRKKLYVSNSFSLKSSLSFWKLIWKTSSLQLRKRFTEQVKMEEARFRQWGAFRTFLDKTFSFRSETDVCVWVRNAEQHLIAERDRLNKDLEQAHSYASPFFFLHLSQKFDWLIARNRLSRSIKSLELELDQIGGPVGYGSTASRNATGRR